MDKGMKDPIGDPGEYDDIVYNEKKDQAMSLNQAQMNDPVGGADATRATNSKKTSGRPRRLEEKEDVKIHNNTRNDNTLRAERIRKEIHDMWDEEKRIIRGREYGIRLNTYIDPDLHRKIKARAAMLDVPIWFLTEKGWEYILEVFNTKK